MEPLLLCAHAPMIVFFGLCLIIAFHPYCQQALRCWAGCMLPFSSRNCFPLLFPSFLHRNLPSKQLRIHTLNKPKFTCIIPINSQLTSTSNFSLKKRHAYSADPNTACRYQPSTTDHTSRLFPTHISVILTQFQPDAIRFFSIYSFILLTIRCKCLRRYL